MAKIDGQAIKDYLDQFILVVQVTSEDILSGKPSDSCSCPVAQAINKTIKEKLRINTSATVTREKIRFYSPGGEVVIATTKTPDRVTKFIHKFDSRQPLSPEREAFSFKLEIPQEVIKLAYAKSGRP